MSGRVSLAYSHTRARPNTWDVTEDYRGIWLRYFEASGPERIFESPIRWRKPFRGALYIRPMDSELETWLTESVVPERGAVRVDFLLTGCPAFVAKGVFCEA